MSAAFFLTRQTANLMEDFAREIEKGSNLFLLYGEKQVGKSWLLDELAKSRLAHLQVRRLDLAPTKDDIQASCIAIIALAETARADEVIIVDHFESAANKVRNQLFQSWATDGADKQLNMIIAGDSLSVEDIRQRASHFQVTVQSCHLQPYSRDEVNAFIGHRLFPDNPLSKPGIPASLNKRINAAGGFIGRIADIIDHDGEQISSGPLEQDKSSPRGGKLLVLMVVAILTLAALAALISRSSQTPTADVVPEVANLAQPQSQPAAVEAQAREVTVDDKPAEPVIALVEAMPVVEIQVDTDAQAVEQAAAEVEVTKATSTDEPTGSTVESAAEPIVVDEPATDKLGMMLEVSLAWINNSDEFSGTIQVMSLTVGNFDEDLFFNYLRKLEAQQVDLAKVRVYRSSVGGSDVYSVVYGDYDSRRAAYNSIDQLPDLLKKNGPIPRSIGGIKDEIVKSGSG